jgi:hypothetical protein
MKAAYPLKAYISMPSSGCIFVSSPTRISDCFPNSTSAGFDSVCKLTVNDSRLMNRTSRRTEDGKLIQLTENYVTAM